MAYELAKAIVKIGTNLNPLSTGLNTAKNMVGNTLRSLSGMIGKLSALAGGLSIGAAIKIGADDEELNSMFEAVFKEGTDRAQEFADELAGRIGRSVQETKRTMSNFQDTFVPLGFAREQARGLSQQMTELASDVASFKNMADGDVANRFTSALVGNHEAVRQLGIVITETSLKQELMRMGAKKVAGQYQTLDKVQARYNLILAGTKDAQGDAERTAGSFTNRFRGLKGAIRDVVGDFGSAFLPMLAELSKKMTDWIREVQPQVRAFAEWFRATIPGVMAEVTKRVQASWTLIKDIWNGGVQFLSDAFKPLLPFLSNLATQLSAWASVVQDNWWEVWKAIRLTFRIAWLDFKTVWGDLPSFFANIGQNVLIVMQNVTKRMIRTLKRAYAEFVITSKHMLSKFMDQGTMKGVGAALGLGGAAEGLKSDRKEIEKALGLDQPMEADKSLVPLFKISEESQAARNELTDTMSKLMELKDQKVIDMKAEVPDFKKAIPKKPIPINAVANSDRIDVKQLKTDRFELKGFVGFEELNQKIQEGLLKGNDEGKRVQRENLRVNRDMLRELREANKHNKKKPKGVPVAGGLP